jgi:hypothetical protein
MKHYKRVSCKIDLGLLIKKDIIAFSQQRQMELSFKSKIEGLAQATFKDFGKTFKVVMEQLEHARGVTGNLLAYVPCKKLILLDEDDNPPTNYPSLDAKAIAHASIFKGHVAFPGQSATAIALLEQKGPFCNTFRINMVMVWNIFVGNVWADTRVASYPSTKKEKNGRKLYHFLLAHNLGSDHVNDLANKMEARLASLTYHSE